MSEPFVAEVKMWGGNFAPRGYSFCNGSLLPISQNTALFSLIGTTYGGDGRTTMGLPNLEGRAAMHPGTGPGLTAKRLGQTGGVPTVTLSIQQTANHNHTLNASGDDTEEEGENGPSNAVTGTLEGANRIYLNAAQNTSFFSAAPNQALANAGGGQAHENKQPYLAVTFIIALVGLYPSRS